MSRQKKNADKIRVVIDAGHGGIRTGAKGFYNLVEKDLALDIAKRTVPLLEKAGFEVHLTRKDDRDISLTDRCKKAESINANLFVSIHANSAGKSETPAGIETFHINSKPLTGEESTFYNLLFVNNKPDRLLALTADTLVRGSEGVSSKFAGSIQNTLINMLKSKNINVNDRGVKKACFMVLLGLLSKIELPAALVEVGFITNKEEAKRLADAQYRTSIAKGIVDGIKKFLANEG